MELPSDRTLRAVLLALCALVLTWQNDLSFQVFRMLGGPDRVVRSPVETELAPDRIRTVLPEAEKAGLRAGQQILAVNGRPYTGSRVLSRALNGARAGDTLRLQTDAGEFAVTLEPRRIGSPWLVLTLGVLLPYACLAFGAWLVLVRPRDSRAWVLLFLLLSFSGLYSVDLPPARRPWPLFVLGVAFRSGLALAWPVWMIQLGIGFPAPFPGPRWMVWLGRSLMAGSLAYAALHLLSAFCADLSVAAAAALAPWMKALRLPATIWGQAGVGFYFAAAHWHLAIAESKDLRRRLVLLLAGSYVSLTPKFVLILISLAGGESMTQRIPGWGVLLGLTAQALFPLAIAYVVLVERALDVRVVLRLGLQYALARRALAVLAVLAGIAFGWSLYVATQGEEISWPRLLVLGGVAAMVQPASRRLNLWLDKRFFREAYDADRLLSELSEQVKTMVEVKPLLETVTRRISVALHVPRAVVLLEEEGGARFTPAFALGFPQDAPPPALPGHSALLARLRQSARPLAAQQESEAQPLGAHLLLPLSGKQGLCGILSLGEKRSEEPYSPADLRLLSSVATQAGLALENARLMAGIAHQMAVREQFDREMAIAREVQQRLFPQKAPAVEGASCAGLCRPARSVGGDYYDFALLSGGELLLAVGDVSGKGLPAALLMAALQASVRGQALNQVTDLAVFTRNVNLLLYDMSPKNHFATLFLALYDPRSWRLRYSLAGHNPPLLLRGNGELDFLKTTGPGVGMTRLAQHGSELLQLAPGDLLVAYTDGFTEAMNEAREEFGELRLMEAVRHARRRQLPPQELIASVVAAVDGFTEGAPQHDDMTMIALEVR